MKAQQRPIAEGALMTDQYQLTMAQLYFRYGLHEKQVQFDHFFRSYPAYDGHKAGYCVNAGLGWFLDWLGEVVFERRDIEHLRGQKGRSGDPVFSGAFLDWLEGRGFLEGLDMRAISEGRVVHPNTPLTVVQAPLAMAQIMETPLLNMLNYQTLIATKTARIAESARGGLLLEFGLRRGHDKGANAGARAALIGGAEFTSNVGLSHVLGLPPKGTHAHSMVQVFMALGEGELAAFRAFADVYPDDCILLVDTIDTLESGIPNAIRVFEELRKKGHTPVGIRLDSGDLAYLSIQAAKMLDEAGFEEAAIVLSNNLDELVIWQITTQIEQEAPRYGADADKVIRRLTYGVGTHLITSWGEPALGGVYKLVAVKEVEDWIPAIKVSETPEKIPNPGNKELWRLYDARGSAFADYLCLSHEDPGGMERLRRFHPTDRTLRAEHVRADISETERMLVEVVRDGKVVQDEVSIEEMRERRRRDVSRLDPGVRRLINPHVYHVSLSEKLSELKKDLIDQARHGGVRLRGGA